MSNDNWVTVDDNFIQSHLPKFNKTMMEISQMDIQNRMCSSNNNMAFEYRNPNRDTEKLLRESNAKLEQLTAELENQTRYIAELESNLKYEIEKRKTTEKKFSKKEWLLKLMELIAAILSGLIILIVGIFIN